MNDLRLVNVDIMMKFPVSIICNLEISKIMHDTIWINPDIFMGLKQYYFRRLQYYNKEIIKWKLYVVNYIQIKRKDNLIYEKYF